MDRIAAGGFHTCARLAVDGSVWCWGHNDRGQLGWGEPTLNMPTRTVPTLVEGLSGPSRAVELALGARHSCALLEDGSARCWGDNDHGQLGDGTTEGRYRPAVVKGLSGATAIAAGDTATCALVKGELLCWGGLPARGGSWAAAPVAKSKDPAKVEGLSGVTGIAVGGAHACALGKDGVHCWGDNAAGQLGDGTTGARAQPVLVRGVTGATRIDAGPSSTCALLRDARVLCWGRIGELDLGPAPKPLPGGSGVAEIAGRCVRGTEGAVSCRRGDGLEVMEERGALRVAAGLQHACLINAAGEARCWGSNGFGQLGDGSKLSRAQPTPPRW